ncbi:MAG TPA: DUF2064 domain-containing protein [Trebonia sp.]|jgi:hypothetical protein|nr:DUF2064 domain-containing protein [Trebonia sp.]
METDIETGQGSQVIVLAETPSPDRADDWLSPPLRPQQAALVAEAALADTLDVAAAAPVTRRVLALDGAPGDWLPAGFRVFGQRGSGLDERLAAAFADAYAVAPLPMVLIGTDTPQVTVDMLGDAAASLESGEADAVFGPSTDGGFWMLGLRRPDRSLLAGVPMSAQDPGRVLLERLAGAGLRVALAPRLTEVSTFESAEQVAGQCPSSRFAAAFAASASGLSPA